MISPLMHSRLHSVGDADIPGNQLCRITLFTRSVFGDYQCFPIHEYCHPTCTL